MYKRKKKRVHGRLSIDLYFFEDVLYGKALPQNRDPDEKLTKTGVRSYPSIAEWGDRGTVTLTEGQRRDNPRVGC